MRNNSPKGVYFDRLITSDKRVTEFGWRSNIIVDQCRELLAAFMKGDQPRGISFLDLGRGDPSWDDIPPPAPESTVQQLVDSSRVRIPANSASIQIDYLDATGTIVSNITNRVQVTATLAPGSLPIGAGETAYPLREFGLIGRMGPRRFMIDYVRHPVINIDSGATFERRIRLVF